VSFVPASSPDSVVDLSLLRARAAPGAAEHIESDVLVLFDRYAPQLLHYASSFGLGTGEAEAVVQETFLALFRQLHLGGNQSNLVGWLFQVTHNLALKQRRKRRRQQERDTWDDAVAGQQTDPALDPEARLMARERRRRLRSVVDALPERERRCLFLRAEGLTYRDLAATLSLSLGGVAKAITRAMTRLVNADGG
jgi:RNA polymerase sigma-70 factor, ECF subfamily